MFGNEIRNTLYMLNIFKRRRHPTEIEIANALGPIAFDPEVPGQAASALRLEPNDAQRFGFSSMIYTICLPMIWAMGRRTINGADIDVGAICGSARILSQRLTESNSMCTIGDYVLNGADYARMGSLLANDYGVQICTDNFNATQCLLKDLIVVVFSFRTEDFFDAMMNAIQIAKGDENKALGLIMHSFSRLILVQSGIPDPYDDASGEGMLNIMMVNDLSEQRYTAVVSTMDRLYNT